MEQYKPSQRLDFIHPPLLQPLRDIHTTVPLKYHTYTKPVAHMSKLDLL